MSALDIGKRLGDVRLPLKSGHASGSAPMSAKRQKRSQIRSRRTSALLTPSRDKGGYS